MVGSIRLGCNVMPTAPTAPTSSADLLDRVPQASRAALGAWVAGQGLPAYRVSEMVRRLCQARGSTWAEAAELPVALRRKVATAFPLGRLRLDVEQLSADGTGKYLWRLADGEAVESV